MKKAIICLLVILIASVCFATTFYYTIDSTATNRAGHDPAKDFILKYFSKYDYKKVFFGKGEAVIWVDNKTTPVISADDIAKWHITSKTTAGVEAITDKKVIDYGFNATRFLTKQQSPIGITP
ncbi:hypothetical protein ACFL09_05755 [Planctomycetota bacterium]